MWGVRDPAEYTSGIKERGETGKGGDQIQRETGKGNKRSHCNEKPAHHNQESPPLSTTRESLSTATKDPAQPKISY